MAVENIVQENSIPVALMFQKQELSSIEVLVLVAAWGLLALILILGVIVLWKIFVGKIDLRFLLSEKNGQASLSRFQFLIFTFVIAAGIILLIVASFSSGQPKFPVIDKGVWALLGISGGSYLTSKGIQKKAEGEEEKKSSGKTGWPAS